MTIGLVNKLTKLMLVASFDQNNHNMYNKRGPAFSKLGLSGVFTGSPVLSAVYTTWLQNNANRQLSNMEANCTGANLAKQKSSRLFGLTSLLMLYVLVDSVSQSWNKVGQIYKVGSENLQMSPVLPLWCFYLFCLVSPMCGREQKWHLLHLLSVLDAWHPSCFC